MNTINLTAEKVSSYSHKTKKDADGNPIKMDLYLVSGDAQSLALYKQEKGEFYYEDPKTGKPCFNAPQSSFIGKTVPLAYNPNTTIKFFIDRSSLEEELILQKNKLKMLGLSDSVIAEGMLKAMTGSQPVAGQQMSLFAETPAEEEDMDLGNLGGE